MIAELSVTRQPSSTRMIKLDVSFDHRYDLKNQAPGWYRLSVCPTGRYLAPLPTSFSVANRVQADKLMGSAMGEVYAVIGIDK